MREIGSWPRERYHPHPSHQRCTGTGSCCLSRWAPPQGVCALQVSRPPAVLGAGPRWLCPCYCCGFAASQNIDTIDIRLPGLKLTSTSFPIVKVLCKWAPMALSSLSTTPHRVGINWMPHEQVQSSTTGISCLPQNAAEGNLEKSPALICPDGSGVLFRQQMHVTLMLFI